MQGSPDIATILSAGYCLIDSKPFNSAPDLKVILCSRLAEYYTRLGLSKCVQENGTLEEVELTTAQEALYVVELVQHVLVVDKDDTNRQPSGKSHNTAATEETPMIGTRDLAMIRMLLSIVFNWGTDLLLTGVASALSGKPASEGHRSPKFVDLATAPDHHHHHHLLASLTSRLMNILFPHGARSLVLQTLITTTILNRHLTDLLRPCISLGWLPNTLASELTPTLDEFRPLVLHLLSILPPSETITSLGAILSHKPSPPLHVRRSCASLLSKQLLRPEGVRGLCDAVFGDSEGDEAPLEKLEHVARILSTVPAAMKPEAYFFVIVPQIISLLSASTPPSHKRAAAFAISRMLATNESFPHQALLSKIVLPIFHKSFFDVPLGFPENIEPECGHSPSLAPAGVQSLTPRRAISTLLIILTNTDPSPLLISALLSPIIPPLYTALFHLDDRKTSDPQLKELLRGILETWGRVVSSQEAVDVLWSVLDYEGEWEADGEGEMRRVIQDRLSSLSFLTPRDLPPERKAEDNFDLNLFNIRPDPFHYVRFVKSLGRQDIASEILVRLLGSYREAKSKPESDPMRTLLYLQLIIQMQSQMSGENGSPNIFSKPDHILSFVKHILEPVNVPSPDSKPKNGRVGNGLRVEDLRFLPDDDQLSNENDNDDETAFTSGDGMTETAINLVLSILEANPTLSTHTISVLDDISSLLQPVANRNSPTRHLAQEARLVITARLASTSIPQKPSPKTNSDEDSQVIYQRALKLLQDPILPVRAHGLLLLRQLVSRSPKYPEKTTIEEALVPAILSIFLRSIQDDDSYMFLNAVQGLAAMVDTFGKDVLKGLVNVYAQGLDGLDATNITQREVDTRLHIGEALGQVIRRCGETLVIYVDILVPPLFHAVRSHHIPTTLRTSSLSLLAECGNTNPISLMPYANDLCEAMIDLLQIESVSGAHPDQKSPEDGSTDEDRPIIDSQPMSTNSKLPPLRRAALHFLSLLFRAMGHSPHSTPIQSILSTKRAKTTLTYIGITDDDRIVRVMAQEAMEELKHLGQAIVGM